jgi:hypothetical protein
MLDYPLELGFRVATIGTRVRVVDAAGRQVGYVRKKKFRLKEEVTVYEDENGRKVLFRIKADRAWDFGASYHVSRPDGRPVGAVRQHATKSLWKSSYAISDDRSEEVGLIHEEKPWVKVLDGLSEALPLGDALGGLFFNPAYLVELRGRTVLRMSKERSLFERRFKIEKLDDFSEENEDAVLASLIMMVLLERDRG